uniref:Fucolectin tachylectin-4 pentraxin-1 domain-containing protein n=1 Tax=Magallana gigas TaxID=29159 RepID=A0A8W8NS62_MAGGI
MDLSMYVFLLCIKGKTLAFDNLSYNKVATQSRTFPGSAYYAANNAVDGNKATCMRANEVGMTALDKTVWWKVDLGGLRNIYSISILFKSYNGYGEYRLIF